MSVNSSKAGRDIMLAFVAVLLTAGADWLNNGGLQGTKYAGLAAVLLVLIQAARRALFPESTPTIVNQASIVGATTRTPSVADLDLPTPIYGSPALAMSADDEQFLAECAAQIHAYTPGGKVKQSNPATLIAILLYLFQHSDEIESLIERAKKFVSGLLAAWRLRRLIKAAMLAEGNTAYPSIDSVDGVATWLDKADGGVIRRVRMIADSRRK